MNKYLTFVVATALLFNTAPMVIAGTKTIVSETATFESCIRYLQTVATDLGVAPTNIVETTDLRIARISTNDGSGVSFLVTCSRPDQKLLITQSD